MPWLLAIFIVCQSYVLAYVNKWVPGDYMDEIFHGPQAREYCRGNFTAWHPKITTFPGLYYLGAFYGWISQPFLGTTSLDAACATPNLRSLNVVLSAACLLVLQAILRTRHSRTAAAAASPSQPRPGVLRSLHALALALYPLHWFFSFLYYTDVASLLFLLLCHLQAARRRYWSSAAAGALAVLCRQTNAVWAAFVLGEAVLAELGMDRAFGTGAFDAAAIAAARADAGANGRIQAAPEQHANVGFLAELQEALIRVWHSRRRLTAALWPLLLPPAAFAAFLLANGGSVVLGDKEAHTPVRHGAQLLYFGAWAALMLWPQLLPELGRLARASVRRPLMAVLLAAAATLAAAAVAHVSTMAHPYLLADNRHYVFYLWRRLLNRTPTTKYALAPAYAASWVLLLSALLRRMSRLWVLGFAACLTATLLPAWLLELRYFTPGFFLIALHLEPPSDLQTGAMLYTFALINACTMYLFLIRPYIFADGSVARFLW